MIRAVVGRTDLLKRHVMQVFYGLIRLRIGEKPDLWAITAFYAAPVIARSGTWAFCEAALNENPF